MNAIPRAAPGRIFIHKQVGRFSIEVSSGSTARDRLGSRYCS